MKNKHQLGDAPIEEQYRVLMNYIAQELDDILNKGKRGKERETGFVLLIFPFGGKEGRCNYISNGADNRDILVLLKEQAARFEAQFHEPPNS